MSDAISVTSEAQTVTSLADTITSVEFNRDEPAIKSLYRLSEDLTKFFEESEGCDVNLEIGKGSDIKKFTAHSFILRARSSYFYKALSKKPEDKNDDNVSYIYTALSTFVSNIHGEDTVVFKKEDVSPKIFKIALEYMYGGIGTTIKLNELTPSEFVILLKTCSELGIYGFDEYFQQYFLQNYDEWIRQNLIYLERFTIKHEALREIRNYCLDQLCQNSDIVFKPIDIKSISKDVLLALISRDDLIADEIDLWNFIIRWGIAQDPDSYNGKTDVSEWTEVEFAKLKAVIGDLVPLIRFKWITSDLFYKAARPYKLIFDSDCYENIMQSYLVKSQEQPETPNSQIPIPTPIDLQLQKGPRVKEGNAMISNYVNLISCWIDKKPYDPDYHNYKFKLLYRGSSEKFSCTTFHKKCDFTSNTLTIARIKNTEELVGGHNPVAWKIAGYGNTATYPIHSKKSFIFKIDKDHLENSIISRVTDYHNALRHRMDTGPNFCDLVIFNKSKPIRYSNHFYDNDLEIEGRELDDYEVYKVLPRC